MPHGFLPGEFVRGPILTDRWVMADQAVDNWVEAESVARTLNRGSPARGTWSEPGPWLRRAWLAGVSRYDLEFPDEDGGICGLGEVEGFFPAVAVPVGVPEGTGGEGGLVGEGVGQSGRHRCRRTVAHTARTLVVSWPWSRVKSG